MIFSALEQIFESFFEGEKDCAVFDFTKARELLLKADLRTF